MSAASERISINETSGISSTRKTNVVLGRYVLCRELARGGMAAVYLGRLRGAKGFARTVAIKRLHATLSTDADFVQMFLDEARLASRVRHPNVIPTLDVVAREDELFLVMEYVEGASLAQLMRAADRKSEETPPPLAVLSGIMCGALHGLQAAHDAKDELGNPLGIVHRDVSPQNILVGTDGVARVLDFGIAKAIGRLHTTRDGQIKGKLAYMAPEQILGKPVDLRADVFAAGIVLWEIATRHRLFYGANDGEIVNRVLNAEIPSARSIDPALPPELDVVLDRALARDPDKRYSTALELATALEELVRPATARQIGEWVRAMEGEAIAKRAADVAAVEAETIVDEPPPSEDDLPTEIAPNPKRGALLAAGAIAIGVVLGLVGWSVFLRAPTTTRDATIASAVQADVPPPKVSVSTISVPVEPTESASSAASTSASASSSARRAPLPPPRRPPVTNGGRPAASAPLYTRD